MEGPTAAPPVGLGEEEPGAASQHGASDVTNAAAGCRAHVRTCGHRAQALPEPPEPLASCHHITPSASEPALQIKHTLSLTGEL